MIETQLELVEPKRGNQDSRVSYTIQEQISGTEPGNNWNQGLLSVFLFLWAHVSSSLPLCRPNYMVRNMDANTAPVHILQPQQFRERKNRLCSHF